MANLIKFLYLLIIVYSLWTLADTRNVRGIPSICLQPPPRSEGICTIEIEGFYYEPRSKDCLPYTISGCRSYPGQSFGSKKTCLDTCLHGSRRIQDLSVYE